MTQDEKFKAIQERAGEKAKALTPMHLSVMMIIGYLSALKELNLVTVPFELPDEGKTFISICGEFDWTPSDEEINDFVTSFVPSNQREQFSFFVKRYRDDKEGLLNDVKKAKKYGNN